MRLHTTVMRWTLARQCGWLSVLVALAALMFAPSSAKAQGDFPNYNVPPEEFPIWAPLADGTSRIEEGGLFLFSEFRFMSTNRALGRQPVAFRGFIDATGITGRPGGDIFGQGGPPGTIIGSGAEALNTGDQGIRSYQPGFNIGIGYRFRNDYTIQVNYMHMFDAAYAASASSVPPFFGGPENLADTFISSQVFNFPPQFNGPTGSGGTAPNTILDTLLPGSTVGIWNAAGVMDIKYTQRFSAMDITGKAPVHQSEYGRTQFLAGGRFAWFWERFWWRSTNYDINGFAVPQYAAEYTNIMSQRMYGPFIGCSHDVYLGNGFSLDFAVSAAALFNITKQRAKYELADRSLQAKRSALDYTLVPNVNLDVNMYWRPVAGIEMRVGYSLWNFFNTFHMEQPIGFNFGAMDPVYEKGYYRFLEGMNVGIALAF